MTSQEIREVVRRAYEYRCGYCGVREEEIGSDLEIDHFKPRAVGGGDEVENLVACCTTCNRFKGDYYHPKKAPLSQRLLHPQRDDLTAHLREDENGYVIALTKRGAFYLERLHLNRPPLVTLRRTRSENAKLRQELIALRKEQTRLQRQLVKRNKQINQILAQLAQLLKS